MMIYVYDMSMPRIQPSNLKGQSLWARWIHIIYTVYFNPTWNFFGKTGQHIFIFVLMLGLSSGLEGSRLCWSEGAVQRCLSWNGVPATAEGLVQQPPLPPSMSRQNICQATQGTECHTCPDTLKVPAKDKTCLRKCPFGIGYEMIWG